MENYPKRREVASQIVEQDKKFKALQALIDAGVLLKVDKLDIYHGRASDNNGQKWQVKPDYNNAGNATGNDNVNKIPALNTADYQTAEKFGKARSGNQNYEIHKIVSNDPDAVIIARKRERTPEEIKEISKNLKKTLIGITAGSPLRFEDRYALNNISPLDLVKNINNEDKMYFYEEDIQAVSQNHKINKKTADQICSAFNTRQILTGGDKNLRALGKAFIDNDSYVTYKNNKVPISREYLANWFRENHIIGIEERVNSATLDFEKITDYNLFDLEKVNTKDAIEEIEHERNICFGKIALAAETKEKENNSPLMELLKNNLYAKPEEILEEAKKTPGFETIFDEDAGNWEKFTLGEHTETVLRVFDNNYADILPASTLPTIRLALLVHDIGKSRAVKNHDKANQKIYNESYAREFMEKNQVDQVTSDLIIAMITEGTTLASQRIMDRNNKKVWAEIWNFSERMAKQYLETDKVDREVVLGFNALLEVIQTCDSAAYTTMAITKQSDNGIKYRNSGSFNQSFEPFTGFTGKRTRLK